MIKSFSDALAERGYDTLTEVQEAVTAPGLETADLLVSAQTGSGKTVAFGLAIAPSLLNDDETLGPPATPMALVVTPTRELAFQVMRELAWLYDKVGARVVSCVGGMDMRDERRALERGAHIVVGTPGRLRDHIQRSSLDLSALRAVVLDEADEMLDLGFRDDLEFMLDAAPAERRTLLFSATVPPAIAKLAQRFQRDAVRVTPTAGAGQHADIAYQALQVADRDAERAIFNLLRYHDARNALVFANTRAAVSHLTARLSNRNFAVVSLSGELSQSERTHALQAMRDGRARVCVATDVAARGIDLPNLELVIHADLPSNAEALLHRSGRTGRAGRKGISAIIITPKIAKKAERLLTFAKIKAEWTTPPGVDDILRRDEERLLADPVWTESTSDEQDAFAAQLLALHPPKKIAAAYLRLYRARQSAPEELSPPDAKSAPKERKSFGPSLWFALSVGRDQRAEARWLLPLLCRAGNLAKEDIGAIRVQQSETFVELTEASVPAFLAGLGGGGELEKGVGIRQLDGPPDGSVPAPAPAPTPAARPEPRPAVTPPTAVPADNAVATDRDPPPRAKQARRALPDRAVAKTDPQPRPAEAVKPAPEVAPPPAEVAPPTAPDPERRKPRHRDLPARDKSAKPPGGKGKYQQNKGHKAAPAKPRTDNPPAPATSLRTDAMDPSKRVARPGKPASKHRGGAKAAPRKARRGDGHEPPRRKS